MVYFFYLHSCFASICLNLIVHVDVAYCIFSFLRPDGFLHIIYSEMVALSIGEKYFIQGGIAQDLRTDGRKRLTPRPIYVETGVISQVE